MYGYDYMKKIVLRRADLKEYVIAERDFKHMYPTAFTVSRNSRSHDVLWGVNTRVMDEKSCESKRLHVCSPEDALKTKRGENGSGMVYDGRREQYQKTDLVFTLSSYKVSLVMVLIPMFPPEPERFLPRDNPLVSVEVLGKYGDFDGYTSDDHVLILEILIKQRWRWRHLIPVESIYHPMLTLNAFKKRHHDKTIWTTTQLPQLLRSSFNDHEKCEPGGSISVHFVLKIYISKQDDEQFESVDTSELELLEDGKSKIPNWSGGVECGGGAVECRWWWYDGGGGRLIFVRKCALNPANNRLAKDITDGTAHRKKKYAELTEQEKLKDDYGVQETNIILQGLPLDVYSLVNHHQAAKDIWDRGQGFAGMGTKQNATSFGGNNVAGQAKVVKCYNFKGEWHIARQCIQPKRPRNSACFKEKMLLVQAQESGQVLDEEQLAFLADCDDISSAKVVRMANISSYDSDVLSEEKLNATVHRH
ncbi:hypothetical protein Tco_0185779 [Tanacetum coccineum]